MMAGGCDPASKDEEDAAPDVAQGKVAAERQPLPMPTPAPLAPAPPQASLLQTPKRQRNTPSGTSAIRDAENIEKDKFWRSLDTSLPASAPGLYILLANGRSSVGVAIESYAHTKTFRADEVVAITQVGSSKHHVRGYVYEHNCWISLVSYEHCTVFSPDTDSLATRLTEEDCAKLTSKGNTLPDWDTLSKEDKGVNQEWTWWKVDTQFHGRKANLPLHDDNDTWEKCRGFQRKWILLILVRPASEMDKIESSRPTPARSESPSPERKGDKDKGEVDDGSGNRGQRHRARHEEDAQRDAGRNQQRDAQGRGRTRKTSCRP